MGIGPYRRKATLYLRPGSEGKKGGLNISNHHHQFWDNLSYSRRIQTDRLTKSYPISSFSNYVMLGDKKY